MAGLKKGDRVRVTTEGKVEHVYADGAILLEGWDISVGGDDPDGYATGPVTIEKIHDPWPTSPGSVIGFNGNTDSKYVLTYDGDWLSLKYGDRVVLNDFPRGSYDVLYDAGKDS